MTSSSAFPPRPPLLSSPPIPVPARSLADKTGVSCPCAGTAANNAADASSAARVGKADDDVIPSPFFGVPAAGDMTRLIPVSIIYVIQLAKCITTLGG